MPSWISPSRACSIKGSLATPVPALTSARSAAACWVQTNHVAPSAPASNSATSRCTAIGVPSTDIAVQAGSGQPVEPAARHAAPLRLARSGRELAGYPDRLPHDGVCRHFDHRDQRKGIDHATRVGGGAFVRLSFRTDKGPTSGTSRAPLSPDFTILAATPTTSWTHHTSGAQELKASLARVLASGRLDVMPLQRCDVDNGSGEFAHASRSTCGLLTVRRGVACRSSRMEP